MISRLASASSASSCQHRTTRLVLQELLMRQPTTIAAPSLAVLYRQHREFSSRRNFKKRKGENPFKVLGVTEETKYSVAKKKFLNIAMSHHPDTSDVESEEDRDKLRDIFIGARMAFEQFVEAPDGSILLIEEAELMPDFDAWFEQQTGHKNPFDVDLDPQTMKEVAEMTETVGGGLDRDGGMWQLAKMVTNAVNSGGDASAMLRLEAGAFNGPNRQITGELRRRRKK
mmetsp:Transcript_22210/g.36771  ORF Transcript_22210/g.36771 Transcript_22210/m.36771 type:complete len:228 (+) Transcript_22210:181-864(+)|eukprot:CAMPEP_0119012942 /NCGR_PEP_ID=MMETSP1176-20130426/7708_1 /TAXON_ID=265551 /ORGANISM="Synedropsis recta cf, Strain CCMP1620" /LENGTH=227 /DNA_ID=CAMNT_0006965981 /DNA_START=155 /DNA_END=838 /DNA_ORIENTATION=+